MSGILAEYELININESLISEANRSVQTGQPLIIRGILQTADKKNRNGRIYPKAVLAKEIEKYQELVRERRSLGELDHPTAAEVNLTNASHLITEMWWDGNKLKGEVELLDTPSGQIAKQLIAHSVPLGISSRGIGSTDEENGVTMVQDDFNLICFDLVSMPSTHGAFLREGQDFSINDDIKTVDVSRLQEISAKILKNY
jgi:hypothetical protein